MDQTEFDAWNDLVETPTINQPCESKILNDS